MAALDLRKDECLERTFKGVAKHFRDIFRELVPGNVAKKEQGGSGDLVMVRSAAAQGGDDDEDDEDGEGGAKSHDTYIGVKVRLAPCAVPALLWAQLLGAACCWCVRRAVSVALTCGAELLLAGTGVGSV